MPPLYFFMEKLGVERPTSKNSGLPIVPIDTNIVDTFSPPPLAPDQHSCAPSPTSPMRAQRWRRERQIWPPRPTVPIDTANRPLSTPPNGLRAAPVPTAFPAAAAVTELPDDVNRSIGLTYFVGTARDGPYVAVGIVACNRIITVNASCSYCLV